jgi:hypothetical protein
MSQYLSQTIYNLGGWVFSPIKYKNCQGVIVRAHYCTVDLCVILSEDRRKIRLIEGNAKCRHLKKLTCKGTLTREKGREVTGESTDHKIGLKIPTWLNVRKKLAISSLLTLINTCRKVPWQVNFFGWRHFALTSVSLIFLRQRVPTGHSGPRIQSGTYTNEVRWWAHKLASRHLD